MRSIDRLMDWFEVDIASNKIPKSKLDGIIKRHDWLLRPDEERPSELWWNCLQSKWDLGGKNTGWKLFIYNDGVRNPEFVDDDGNMRTAMENELPKNADRRYGEAILGRVFQIIEAGYKLHPEYEGKWWNEIKDQVFLPTKDQMDDMLLNDGEIEISFSKMRDERTDDNPERKVNPDVHVDPDDAYLISDEARAFIEKFKPTEEKHFYRLKIGMTDKEALEEQYSWYLLTQPWNDYATKKVTDSGLLAKFKQKIAKPNPNAVPKDSTECEKGGSHEWVTSLDAGLEKDDGKSLQVCRKCRKYAV